MKRIAIVFAIAIPVLCVGATSAFAQLAPVLTMPPTASPGSPMTVSGTGYERGEPVDVWFGPSRSGATSSGVAYADQNGSWSIPVAVPQDAHGKCYVSAQGSESGWTATGALQILTGASTYPPAGDLSVSPLDGIPGATAIVSGSGFPINTLVTVSFGPDQVGTATTNDEGDFQLNTTVPNLPQGTVAVTATDASPYNPPEFYIDASPSNTPSAPTCTLSSSATFIAPGNDTILSWASSNATSFSIDNGVGAVSPAADGEVASGLINADTTFTGTATGPGGTVTCSVPVTVTTTPASPPPPSEPTVSALGDLSVSPLDGTAGTSVTVSGSAFPVNTPVTVYFGGDEAGTATTNAQGMFQADMIVPNLPGGTAAVTATDANPLNPPEFYVDTAGTSSATPTTTTSTSSGTPALTLGPTSGDGGAQIAINGSGFSPDETVSITFGTYATSLSADGNGNFGTTLTAPYVGDDESLTVTATGQQSGHTASATFYDYGTSDTTTTSPAPTDDSTLESEIASLQQEVAQLTSELNAWISQH